MKRTARFLTALFLVLALISSLAFGQQKPAPNPPPKAPVQGYTRTNKHTGQLEQVRPHKRRLPKPKSVQVQTYTRNGKPVAGHERQPPAKPADNAKPAH